MPMTPLCSRPMVLLAVLAFLCIGIVTAQDKPDRPPWAQKSKPASNSTPTPAPASPTGEPGKIVQPTASAPNESQDAAAQRGRIRVNVNLVNVLVSVLDEH